MFKFFNSNHEDLAKKLRKAVMVSSRLYLASSSMFELLALATSVKEWAKKIEPKKQQAKATRAWLDEPKNMSKAKSALAKAVVDVPDKKKRKHKKAVLKDDSNDSSDASSGDKRKRGNKGKGDSSSDSDDSDEGKQSKKKRRVKEASTKQKRTMASDSDSTDDEKDKKEKKQKKDKKGRDNDTSESGSSDDEVDKKEKTKKAKAKKAATEAAATAMTLPSDSEDDGEDVGAHEAVTAWGVAQIQQCEATVATWKTMMDDSVNGPTLPRVKDMFQSIPKAALTFGGMEQMAEAVLVKAKLGQKQVIAAVGALESLTIKLLGFYERQSGLSAGSGTGKGAGNEAPQNKDGELADKTEEKPLEQPA
jgi:hypothetical protein